MSNFFRKISQSLVVLVLVLAVFTGHVSAVEGDTLPSSFDVGPSASADSAPDTDAPSDTGSPDDAQDGSQDASEDFAGEGGGSNLPSSSFDTFTVSGADVTVNVEKHDTLSVASVSPDTPDGPVSFYSSPGDTATPTLAETIRSLFGSYTPCTQTVTTYYDGQPISTEEQIVPGVAGLDFEWLAGVGMFAMITFCLFRLLGGVLRNG